MADNTLQNGVDNIATDDLTTLNGGAVSGFKVQRVKVGFGSDGALRDVDATNGLPVAQNDVTASGTLTAAAQTVVLGLNGQSGASVQLSGTWVGTITFEGSNDGTNWTSVNAVAATTSQPQPTATVNGLYRLTPGGLMQLRANMTAFTSGSASVSMRASAGTGGIFANQILPTKITDGTNTATIKAASTAAVAGDSPIVVTIHPSTATQPVSAASLPLPTGASTETTLAALNTKVTAVNTGAVTISAALPAGTNSIGTVNAAQSDIVASGNITTQNLVPAGVATAGSAVELTLLNASTLSIQVTGTYTGALSLQATIDNTNWITIGGTPLINVNTGGYLASITSALTGIFQAECSGFIKIRVTALAAVTGTAVVSLRAVMDSSMVALDAALPAGTNIIGSVNGNGTFVVGGTAASGSAVQGNPVSCAGVVRTDAGTLTTAGVNVRFNMTTSGQLNVKPYGMPESDWQFASAAGGIINTTDVVAKAAGAAGIRNYVTGIDMRNSHATVATEVVIKDGATVIWRGQLPANSPTVDVGFMTPLKGTAATAINVACITTGASVYVNLQGYIGN